jgi:hypothetical protein
MIHIGCTASRNGLTEPQIKVAHSLLAGFHLAALPGRLTLHHGDCVKGDALLAAIADTLGAATEAHPGNQEKMRAGHRSTVIHPPKPFYRRNGDIIAASARILGFPGTPVDPGVGSGSWQVIRRSVRAQVPTCVVLPDGSWEWLS